MSREWKPGDVAMVSLFDGEEVRAIRVARCPMCRRHGDSPHWHCGSEHGGNLPSSKDADARPLVVLDPEDREEVERLMDTYMGQFDSYPPSTTEADHMQAALRELANPTPPKPDEPMGLGAVVEGVCGCSRDARRFVRDPDARDFNLPPKRNGMADGSEVPWVSRCGHHGYAEIDAVKVLSEGVR